MLLTETMKMFLVIQVTFAICAIFVALVHLDRIDMSARDRLKESCKLAVFTTFGYVTVPVYIIYFGSKFMVQFIKDVINDN